MFFARRKNIRLEAAGAQAQRMHAERRQLRAEQLAWVFKAAMAASDARRKARAWCLWHQLQVPIKYVKTFSVMHAMFVRILYEVFPNHTSTLSSSMVARQQESQTTSVVSRILGGGGCTIFL